MKKEIKHSSNQEEWNGKSLRSRMEEAEQRISDLEDSTEQLKTSRKDYKKFKNTEKWNNQELWDTIKDQTSTL